MRTGRNPVMGGSCCLWGGTGRGVVGGRLPGVCFFTYRGILNLPIGSNLDDYRSYVCFIPTGEKCSVSYML